MRSTVCRRNSRRRRLTHCTALRRQHTPTWGHGVQTHLIPVKRPAVRLCRGHAHQTAGRTHAVRLVSDRRRRRGIRTAGPRVMQLPEPMPGRGNPGTRFRHRTPVAVQPTIKTTAVPVIRQTPPAPTRRRTRACNNNLVCQIHNVRARIVYTRALSAVNPTSCRAPVRRPSSAAVCGRLHRVTALRPAAVTSVHAARLHTELIAARPTMRVVIGLVRIHVSTSELQTHRLLVRARLREDGRPIAEGRVAHQPLRTRRIRKNGHQQREHRSNEPPHDSTHRAGHCAT